MADIDYYETDHAPRADYRNVAPSDQSATGARWINWAGAFVSLGLVIGMGVWAFQLTMRDVSGVPVIEALEGPMRVPPADPGGAQAPHQGLAVNRIAEGAEAEAVPDRVVLAPPPVDLDSVTLQSASIPEVSEIVGSERVNTETQALIDRLIARGGVIDAPQDVPAPEIIDSDAGLAGAPDAGTATEETRVIPANVPGVARSLRPVTRPSDLSARAPAAEAAAPAITQEVDAATLPSGSGGSEFFRLRAHGFDNLDASRRFCTALVAQNAACIPATVRDVGLRPRSLAALARPYQAEAAFFADAQPWGFILFARNIERPGSTSAS
jgi:hypothetical protein